MRKKIKEQWVIMKNGTRMSRIYEYEHEAKNELIRFLTTSGAVGGEIGYFFKEGTYYFNNHKYYVVRVYDN